MKKLVDSYKKATHRLLLLDYDGTLADIAPRPIDAVPTQRALETLQKLAADQANTVVIISGRPRHRLDEWLGHIGLDMSAEHGFFIKAGGGEWSASAEVREDWQPQVRQLMERAVAELPSSFVTAKSISLIWHYRQADQFAAGPVIGRLEKKLARLVADLGLQVQLGHKVVEVRQGGYSKATAAAYWLKKGPYDFMLAAGDDITDEDMFAALPKTAFIIKIGIGDTPTVANQSLPGPSAFLALLGKLF